MPELPEVETVRRGLQTVLTGKQIREVRLHRKDLRQPFPPKFAKELKDRRIQVVERRGKYLLIHLSGGLTLVAHLGMSGSFIFHSAPPETLKTHDHVVFVLEGDSVLIFNDPRRFGLMTLAKTTALKTHPLLAELGPEPLSRAFSARYLEAALAKRKGPIKPTLMDAALVAGVGNIYASEALFTAKINPLTPAYAAAHKAEVLVKAIRYVLEKAIASGGSSLRDFYHANGDPGRFQHHFSVYNRDGQLCTVCHTPIKMIRQAGRATYYCPVCQSK